MINVNPGNFNKLKALLASGQLTEEDLSGMPMRVSYGPAPQVAPQAATQNALMQALSDGLPENFIRNEQTGTVTPIGSSAGRAGAQNAPMRLAGFGGGMLTDLGSDNGGNFAIDYSRPGTEIAGLGKGYYTKDGRSAIVTAPDGSKTRVLLGYDAEASAQRNKEALARRMGEAQIAHLYEQISSSEATRNQKEGIPGMGIPQSALEKQFGKAPEGQRWNANGVLESIPGADQTAKSTEDEKRSAGLAIRMENSLKRMAQYPDAVKPQPLSNVLRAVPIVGETMGNLNDSPERRIVGSSQLDALDAALTLATGAAYTKDQLKNLSVAYFPQVGDGEKEIQDKAARFNDVVETARIRAGRMAPKINEVLTRPQPSQQQPQQPPMTPGERARTVFEAKKAIQEGRNRALVVQRLQSMGIDPREAGL